MFLTSQFLTQLLKTTAADASIQQTVIDTSKVTHPAIPSLPTYRTGHTHPSTQDISPTLNVIVKGTHCVPMVLSILFVCLGACRFMIQALCATVVGVSWALLWDVLFEGQLEGVKDLINLLWTSLRPALLGATALGVFYGLAVGIFTWAYLLANKGLPDVESSATSTCSTAAPVAKSQRNGRRAVGRQLADVAVFLFVGTASIPIGALIIRMWFDGGIDNVTTNPIRTTIFTSVGCIVNAACQLYYIWRNVQEKGEGGEGSTSGVAEESLPLVQREGEPSGVDARSRG